MRQVQLLRGPLSADRASGGSTGHADPALELALARATLTAARAGEIGEVVRVYRPASPVVAFGRRDTRSPGFPAAAAAARAAGFEPVVRAVGGRAVAYTSAAVVVDHVRAEEGAVGGQDERFARFGEVFASVLRRYDVDARLGAVPGEYCPGAHSVNARGTEKLVGTAQRITPGAWLFSSLLVVGDEDRLRPVLAEVYRCLGQDLDVASVGSLARETARETGRSGRSGRTSTDEVDALADAVADDLAAALAGPRARPVPVGDHLLAAAHEVLDQHRVA